MTDLYVKNILPHLTIDQQMETMQVLISNEEQSEENKERIEELRNDLYQLG